jgi:hypothetical protein
MKQRMRKGLNYRRSSVCFKSISNLRKNGSEVSGKRPIVAIEAELKPKMVETFDNVADTYTRLRRLLDQDSVVVVGSEAAFGCVVLLALIVQRRDDRGNPDLAVAAVEVGILALALLRCLRCVHD